MKDATINELIDEKVKDVPVEGIEGFTHHFANVNETRIHYVSGGSGPAIVLLHGWPYSWFEWRNIMPALSAAGFTVIAPDLRGFGDSDKPDSGYLKRNVAKDIYELIKQIGFSEINLLGIDIGMMVAYAYASSYPDKVNRLILGEGVLPGFGLEEIMNPAAGGSWHFGFQAQAKFAAMVTEGNEAKYLTNFWNLMEPLHGPNKETTAELLKHYTSPGGMLGGFQHYATLLEDGKYNRENFKMLSMPVLVLNGDHGLPQAATLASVKQVASDIITELVPDSGHPLAEGNPEYTARILINFFKSRKL